ncbi:polysaccharide deacetylase family protein [Flavobacterium sp. LMO8]|uniref:polysaccharide deacetylase family protein n=1 Tax=Flavobacterium sp. LMO8 TaxID=2654244 RepID=UPI0013969812|nr:polysaccharide deacetylase family protein [Flavobacterium sp. LMO8]
MKGKNNTGIPILYYHSIANHEQVTPWSFLSVSIAVFKAQIDYLKRHHFQSCTWKELDQHIMGLNPLPERTVMFHFDDGFLDNWSVVFPIMKEAGFTYSIVVTPDFIEDGPIRPFVTETTLSNVSDWWGYLNRNEIQFMSNSGLVDFQAHGFTHTWYEASDELIDVYDGVKLYPHLGWNLFPEKKPKWLQTSLNVPMGYPVFEYKKSLELRQRFIPDPDFIEQAITLFDASQSQAERLAVLKQLKSKFTSIGRYETEEEQVLRLKNELESTRLFISEIIQKPVEYLVFPGGGSSPQVLEAAKKAGYLLVSKGTQLNTFGSQLFQVSRYSAVYLFPKPIQVVANIYFLRLQIARAKGNRWVQLLFKILKR